ncbi:hypothetical protein LTR66_017087, partial [Elasticomyces elasticus]
SQIIRHIPKGQGQRRSNEGRICHFRSRRKRSHKSHLRKFHRQHRDLHSHRASGHVI